MEYEGLSKICFTCGRVGHAKASGPTVVRALTKMSVEMFDGSAQPQQGDIARTPMTPADV